MESLSTSWSNIAEFIGAIGTQHEIGFYKERAAATVGSGTSEIQRNIIAQRGLGLPRI